MFVKGLFSVSLGANNRNEVIAKIDIIIIKGNLIVIFSNKKGKILNCKMDVIKHCQLFLACTPKAKNLKKLKNKSVIITVSKYLKIMPINKIIRTLEIVK